MDITAAIRHEIVQLFRTGKMKYREIASQLQVSLGSVANIIKLWRSTGNVTARRFGRPPTNCVLHERTSRLVIRQSVLDPRATARQIRDRVGGEAALVSLSTIKRRLRAGGRIAYRQMPAPFLNNKRKLIRLKRGRRHRLWSKARWSKVRYDNYVFVKCSAHEVALWG